MISRIFKSKWTWLVGSLLAASLAISFVAATRRLLATARGRIEKMAAASIEGCELRMGPFSTNFLDRVTMEGLQVSNPGGFGNGTLLDVERVRLKIRLRDLWALARARWEGPGKARELKESAALVELVHPVLKLSRGAEGWNLPKLRKEGGAGAALAFRIALEAGGLHCQDAAGRWDGLELRNVSGFFEALPGGLNFDLSAGTPAGEKIRAQAAPQPDGKIGLKLRGEDLAAGDFLRRFEVLPGSFALVGGFDADLEAFADWPLDPKNPGSWKFSGEARIRSSSAVLSRADVAVPFQASAELKFSQDRVELSSFSLKTSSSELAGAAALLSPLQDRALQGRLSGKLGLGEFWALLGRESRPRGEADLALSLSGSAASPALAGSVKILDGKVADFPFSAASEFAYSSGALEVRSLEGRWGGGTLALSGRFARDRQRWKAELRELPLESFFINRSFSLGGRVSLSLQGGGSLREPALAGKISARDVTWGGTRIARAGGFIRQGGGRLRVQLASPEGRDRLDLDVESREDRWLIRQCRLALAGGDVLGFAGEAEKDTRRIRIKVTGRSVSAARVEPAVKFLSAFEGRFNLSGEIGGAWDAPAFQGHLSAERLAFRDKRFDPQPVGPFSARMLWDRNAFELPGFKIGESYEGSFKLVSRPAKKFETVVRARKADPKVLFAVLGVKAELTGRLSGDLRVVHAEDPDFSKSEPPWEGGGSLEILYGHWDAVPFQALRLKCAFSPAGIDVQDFSIRQKDGGLVARASAPQSKPENPLKVSASLKRFLVADKRLDGDFALDGTLVLGREEWLTGKAASARFSFNGFSAGKLESSLTLKNKVLDLANCAWGDFFQGNFKILFGQSGAPRIEGRWSSGAKTVEEWRTILDLNPLPLSGQVALSGEVAGEVGDPEYTLAARLAGLEVRSQKPGTPAPETAFDGAGSAAYSKKMLKSLSLKLTGKDGSRIMLLGQADLNSRSLDLETSFSDLDAALFTRPWGWQALQGKCSGLLTIQGSIDDPLLKGELKGKEGALGGIPLESWEIAGIFQQKELQFSRVNFYGRKGSWRFSVLEDSWIRPPEGASPGIYRLATDFANVSLGPVNFVGSGVVEGNWKAPEEPGGSVAYQGNLKINECLANDFELKPATLRFHWQDKTLQFLPNPPGAPAGPSVTGSVNFSKLPCILFSQLTVAEPQKRIFFMDGRLCPKDPGFRVEASGVDASLVSRILDSPLNLYGKSDFRIEGIVQNGGPVFRGGLSLADGRVEQIPLDEFSTRFEWKEGILSVRGLSAKSKQYFNLTADGSFPLAYAKIKATNPRIDFSAKCSDGDLAFLNLLETDWVRDAKGKMSGHVVIRGKPGSARVDGDLAVSGGEFGSRYLGSRAQNASLKVSVRNNKVTVQDGRAQVGKGKVKLSGTLFCSVDEDGMGFDRFHLALQTLDNKGVPLRAPELPIAKEKLNLLSSPSRSVTLFALNLTGTRDRPKLSGWVLLDDALFSYPPEKSGNEGRSPLADVDWDLELKTGRQTVFENDLAHARIEGSLRFKGPGNDLLVNGKITSDEGTVTLYGATFNLKDAMLEVAQPQAFAIGQGTVTVAEPKNEVFLQFRAEETKKIENDLTDTITLQLERSPLTEKFDSKKLTFHSAQHPNLDSETVATQAGIGVNFQSLNPEQKDSELRRGLAQLIDAQLAAPLARAVIQKTGLVNKIEFTHDSETPRSQSVRGNTPSPIDPFLGESLSIGRTFGRHLDISYKATLDKIQDRPDLLHQLQLQYMLRQGLWIYGKRDLDSKENIGQNPDSEVGVGTRFKFDFPDLFGGSKPDKPEPKTPKK